MSDQNEDDDILQDFLVEAGEILEKLNGQLVELEQRPQDRDLLNSVFRSFHTIKAAAAFWASRHWLRFVIALKTCSTYCARVNGRSMRRSWIPSCRCWTSSMKCSRN